MTFSVYGAVMHHTPSRVYALRRNDKTRGKQGTFKHGNDKVETIGRKETLVTVQYTIPRVCPYHCSELLTPIGYVTSFLPP